LAKETTAANHKPDFSEAFSIVSVSNGFQEKNDAFDDRFLV